MKCYFVFCADGHWVPSGTAEQQPFKRHAGEVFDTTLLGHPEYRRFTNVLRDTLVDAMMEIPNRKGSDIKVVPFRGVTIFVISVSVYCSLQGRLSDIFADSVAKFVHAETARLVEDI